MIHRTTIDFTRSKHESAHFVRMAKPKQAFYPQPDIHPVTPRFQTSNFTIQTSPMAKKKPVNKETTKSVETITHTEDKRKNIGERQW